MQALDVGPTFKTLSDLLPVFPSLLTDSLSEQAVLISRPVALGLAALQQHVLRGLLILRRPSLVEVRVQHLVPDQVPLRLVVVHADHRGRQLRVGERRRALTIDLEAGGLLRVILPGSGSRNDAVFVGRNRTDLCLLCEARFVDLHLLYLVQHISLALVETLLQDLLLLRAQLGQSLGRHE